MVELAALRFENGEPTDSFCTLVHARIPVTPDARNVHGIDDDDLVDAPPVGEAVRGLLAFVGQGPVALHHARFDLGFLSRELLAHGLQARVPIIDTCELARDLRPELPSRELGAVCERLGIRVSARHRAKGDAEATGRVLWKMLGATRAGAAAKLADMSSRFQPWQPLSFSGLRQCKAIARLMKIAPPGSDVRFEYSPEAGPTTTRSATVEFYSRRDENAYMVARCHLHQYERRTFRIDRITHPRAAE
ncbi:MAG TPA: exonuclease domain-containing protein [Armatimonadota bacterium]|nr:exonuclease domain-containing protein [Armatimonadota bacterium]